MTGLHAQLTSATQAMVDYIAPILADDEPPTEVGVFYPSTSTPEAPAIPFVQVALDGTTGVQNAAVTANSTIRLTVWHNQPDDAETLAWRLLALIEGYPGGLKAWAMRPLTGPLSTRDPDTGAHLCSLTARVSVRPTAA